MENLSVGKLRRKIRKLERKIKGEKSAGWYFFDVFKQKITSPVGIGIAVVASAVIGWFSFKKIKKIRAMKTTAKFSKNIVPAPQSSLRRNLRPLLINAATLVSVLSSTVGLFLGSKKSK